MEYLASLGHRRIGFINGPEDWTVSHDRLQGYKTAAGALQALREYGLQVPEDVSVVGVNDELVSRAHQPALTTVAVHPRQLGRHAADMLMRIIMGTDTDEGYSVIVPAELAIRNSAGSAKQPYLSRGCACCGFSPRLRPERFASFWRVCSQNCFRFEKK